MTCSFRGHRAGRRIGIRTATVGLPVSQTNPATHPTILTVCHRPAPWGAGRRPARHVKRTLTARADAGGSGVGLLGLPGLVAGGLAYRNHSPTVTRRRSPGHPGARSPPAGGAVATTPRPPPPRRRDRRALPCAARAPGRAARPTAGPTPQSVQRSVVLQGPARLLVIRASRRASCVPAAERQRQRPACAQAAARAVRQGPP